MPALASTFISELFSFEDTAAGRARLEKAAREFYEKCNSLAEKRKKKQAGGGIDEVLHVMDGKLLEVLGSVSFLTNQGQYETLMRAVERWHVKTAMELGDVDPENPEHIRALRLLGELFHVRAEMERVLHDRPEQIRRKRHELRDKVGAWIKHIDEKIKDSPHNPLLYAKKLALEGLSESLSDRDRLGRPIYEIEAYAAQLKEFDRKYKSNRSLLDASLDSTEKTIAKSIATLLSLGVAWLCGLWTTDCNKRSKELEGIINEGKQPEPLAKKTKPEAKLK